MPLKDDTPLAKRLLQYYQQLEPPYPLPDGVEVLFPQQDKAVMKLVEQFLLKFYDDTRPRKLMLGINPGRLGAGLTGINFTTATIEQVLPMFGNFLFFCPEQMLIKNILMKSRLND